MDTTAKALIDHWSWAAGRGLMNSNTASALRAACTQVLGVQENWESLDIRSIDPNDFINRFQNLRSKDFNPTSLETYGRRFRRAIQLFLSYVDDPSGWKPAARPKRISGIGNDRQRRGPSDPTTADRHPTEPVGTLPPSKGLIDYPFPLREDVVARLMLPRDITANEVKRLHGFMTALAVEEP